MRIFDGRMAIGWQEPAEEWVGCRFPVRMLSAGLSGAESPAEVGRLWKYCEARRSGGEASGRFQRTEACPERLGTYDVTR